MAKLNLRNISHSYKDKDVLNNVSFTIENGITALLGPNGAGKSTMIKIITGLLSPTEGSVLFNDIDIVKLGNKYYDYLGYLPQTPHFYNNFSGKEFLKYISILKGVPKALASQRVDELLETVNLVDDKNRKIDAYSGGMKQRLGIAQALLNDPQILILDEPTAGLDPNERIRFRNVISNISRNRIVLLATHIVSDVECIAKNVMLLKDGQAIISSDVKSVSNELDMVVWSVAVETEEMVDRIVAEYLVANIKENSHGGFSLKIISKESPDPSAIAINPSLEDVFLYYFNTEKRGSQCD